MLNPKSIHGHDEIRDFFKRYDTYIAHNCRRFDIPNLERLLGIEIDKKIVDTLALSWYLEPKRTKSSLDQYGKEFGLLKIKIDDWEGLNLETYTLRCEVDVRINMKLWNQQLQYLNKLYEKPDDLWRFLKYIDFKMYCAMLQEKSGWRLNVSQCEKNLEVLEELRKEKVDELQRAMPRVPVVRTYLRPKRDYNSDGQLSILGQRWQDLLVERGLPSDHDGPIEVVIGDDEPNPRSNPQIKAWLYSLGWIPQTIKYQRDKETGDIKQIPQVNKEHGAGICDSIKKLYEKEPSLEVLDGLSVISHRISILNGFLRDVDASGYIRAAIQGFTNTLRFKHAVVVNLPKVEKKYGDLLRSCLIAPDDEELCGSDMSSLEDKLKQHFIFKFDPEYVEEVSNSDWDPHLNLAVTAGMITKAESDFYKWYQENH